MFMGESDGIITTYYKNLFSAPEPWLFVIMNGQRIEDIPQAIEVGNELITRNFSEAKLFKGDHFQMKHNLASGLDGLSIEFY